MALNISCYLKHVVFAAKIIENEEMVKKGKEDWKEKKAPFPVPEINSVPNRMFRKSNFFGGS